MSDILSTGVTALLAFQRSMATTSHNVANVNTDGYTRQRVDLGTQTPQYLGGNYVGNGVSVEGIRRIYDQFLTEQVRNSTAAYNQQDTLNRMAGQIDNMLADPQAGLMPVLQDFFGSIQDLSSDPSSTSARQVVLGDANTLTARFNSLYAQLDGLRDGVNTQLSSEVQDINSIASSIADVNKSILQSPGSTAANDLLDRRDALLKQLSEHVAVSTVTQDDGTVNVFVGNGQSLVIGTQSQELALTGNEYDPTQLQIGYKADTSAVDITTQFTGGKLGGLLAFRDQVLDPAMNQLGRVAIGLGDTFNAQHKLGQDLNGNAGTDFFSLGSPEVLASAKNTGGGTATATITDANALTASDYQLSYDGSNYTVTRLSDGSASSFAPGALPATVDGLEIDASGMAAGDSFLIRPTRTGAENIGVAIADTNDIAAASPIRVDAASGNSGTGQITDSSVITTGALDHDVSIQFVTSSTFTITDATTGATTGPQTYTSGEAITYNGWSLTITGAPMAGDTFTVGLNTGGTGDNRNALQLADLQTAKTMGNSSSTYQDTYGQLVADVGTKTHEAQMASDAQSALLNQAVASRDSKSGVNLDEEAADLMKFQQAYQAAAQVISVGKTLFDTILAATAR